MAYIKERGNNNYFVRVSLFQSLVIFIWMRSNRIMFRS